MPTTIIEVLAAADSTEVTLTSRGGTTGTASNPYTLTRIAGKLCTISVDEALTGDWVASDGEIETGINDLVDAAITVRLGNVPTATEISDRIERTGGPLDLLETTALTGPNTVTVTVADSVSTDAIEGAYVTISRPGYSQTQRTNSSGQLPTPFTVVDADWKIEVTHDGYFGQQVTRTIDGNHDEPIALVARAVSAPADPTVCRLTAKIVNGHGTKLVGAKVTPELVGSLLRIAGGFAIDSPVSKVTDSDGLVTFDLLQGARFDYHIRYNSEVLSSQVLVPNEATANVEVEV